MKNIAWIFGVLFLATGFLGFVPEATPKGLLFGLFEVDGIHNVIHLSTGAIAIIAALYTESASRTFFQAVGVIYGVVAILGFLAAPNPLMGMVHLNSADNFLHLGVSAVAIYLGFIAKERVSRVYEITDRDHKERNAA